MAMGEGVRSGGNASLELGDLLLALDDGTGAAGTRRVAEMLAGADLLIDALCHPGLSREQVLRLARQAMTISPGLKYKLMNVLSTDCAFGERDETAKVRALDVLGELFKREAPPALRRLRRRGTVKLRAKAAFAVGRNEQDISWAEQALDDPDPRMRANAVEAIASRHGSRRLLEKAAGDPHRRVRANALLALHRLGAPEAEKELLDLSANRSPFARSAAAWAMGKTGDAVFAETLGWMLGDPDARVRKRAFDAIKAIKSAQSERKAQPT